MKRISLFVAEPQYAAFQALALEEGRPYAELMREALTEFLRKRRAGAPPRRAADASRGSRHAGGRGQ